MSLIQIVCANCGAKYRLPETFQSDHARCKACGATIDVAGQRSAPATPAKPAPIAQKPVPAAKPGSRAAARDEKDARPEKVERHGRHGRAHAGKEHGHGRHRHGHREEAPAKGKGMLLGGGIAVVAILAVGAWFAFQGDEKPAENQSAKAPAEKPATPDPAKIAAEAAAAKEAEEKRLAEEAAAKLEEEKKAAEASAKKAREAKPAEEPVVTADQVFDPKTLPELPLAEDVTDEEKASIAEWIAAADEGGLQWIRAKRELADLKHKGLAPIVNRLRVVNYLDRAETMGAFELNQLLTSMLVVVNAGFKPVELGDTPVEPAIAHYNARTVEAWQRAVDKWGTADAFAAHLKAMRERQKDR